MEKLAKKGKLGMFGNVAKQLLDEKKKGYLSNLVIVGHDKTGKKTV